MTNKIRKYFELINSPRKTSLDEEIKVIEEIGKLLKDAPRVKKTIVTRYIKDDGNKMTCIYETREADMTEMGFIIQELQKLHPNAFIFASPSERYEVVDGLE